MFKTCTRNCFWQRSRSAQSLHVNHPAQYAIPCLQLPGNSGATGSTQMTEKKHCSGHHSRRRRGSLEAQEEKVNFVTLYYSIIQVVQKNHSSISAQHLQTFCNSLESQLVAAHPQRRAWISEGEETTQHPITPTRERGLFPYLTTYPPVHTSSSNPTIQHTFLNLQSPDQFISLQGS